jgi:hypothetical protein
VHGAASIAESPQDNNTFALRCSLVLVCAALPLLLLLIVGNAAFFVQLLR